MKTNWKFCVVATIGTIVGGVISSQLIAGPTPCKSGKHLVVQAEVFQLINRDGKVVASLSAMQDNLPGIALSFGENPMAVASMIVAENGLLNLQFGGPDQQSEAGLVLSKHDGAFLEIGKWQGTARVTLGLSASGDPSLKLTNAKGTSTVKGILPY